MEGRDFPKTRNQENIKEKRSSLQISVTWSEAQLGKGFRPWEIRDQAGPSRLSCLIGLILNFGGQKWAGSEQGRDQGYSIHQDYLSPGNPCTAARPSEPLGWKPTQRPDFLHQNFLLFLRCFVFLNLFPLFVVWPRESWRPTSGAPTLLSTALSHLVLVSWVSSEKGTHVGWLVWTRKRKGQS